MTTDATSPESSTHVPSFRGPARFFDDSGMLIDVGRAELTVTDPETGAWGGHLYLFKGAALTSKRIVGLLEVGGRRARVVSGPGGAPGADDLVAVPIQGLDGPAPFEG